MHILLEKGQKKTKEYGKSRQEGSHYHWAEKEYLREERNSSQDSTRAKIQTLLQGVAMAHHLAKSAEFLQAEADKQKTNCSQRDVRGSHPMGYSLDLLHRMLPTGVPSGFI